MQQSPVNPYICIQNLQNRVTSTSPVSEYLYHVYVKTACTEVILLEAKVLQSLLHQCLKLIFHEDIKTVQYGLPSACKTLSKKELNFSNHDTE